MFFTIPFSCSLIPPKSPAHRRPIFMILYAQAHPTAFSNFHYDFWVNMRGKKNAMGATFCKRHWAKQTKVRFHGVWLFIYCILAKFVTKHRNDGCLASFTCFLFDQFWAETVLQFAPPTFFAIFRFIHPKIIRKILCQVLPHLSFASYQTLSIRFVVHRALANSLPYKTVKQSSWNQSLKSVTQTVRRYNQSVVQSTYCTHIY